MFAIINSQENSPEFCISVANFADRALKDIWKLFFIILDRDPINLVPLYNAFSVKNVWTVDDDNFFVHIFLISIQADRTETHLKFGLRHADPNCNTLVGTLWE